MKNNNNYEYLLNKLTKIKGVGKKTTEILKKRVSQIYLIYYGDFQSRILIDLPNLKLMSYKLDSCLLLL